MYDAGTMTAGEGGPSRERSMGAGVCGGGRAQPGPGLRGHLEALRRGVLAPLLILQRDGLCQLEAARALGYLQCAFAHALVVACAVPETEEETEEIGGIG